MATGLIKDLSRVYPDINPEENENLIVSRGKVRSQRKKVYGTLGETPADATYAIGWDGKKMQGIEREEFNDGTSRNTLKNKEVIVVTDLVKEEYISDFRTDSSKGKAVADGLANKLKAKSIDPSNISIVSGDSTSSMTGYKEGSISWLEELAGRSFNWFICFSHLLELPLRKLAEYFIGPTTGPSSFNSVLGKSIEQMNHVPDAVDFEAIQCDDFPSLDGRE